MTDRFERAFQYILKYEGEYVKDVNDAGGETKFGISKRVYPDLDIKNLTKENAKNIYYYDYYENGPFEKIKDENIAIKLFDLTINMGAKQANKLIQRALRSIEKEVADDGIIGPISLKAINDSDPKLLMAALKSESAGFYRLLAHQNTTQQKFLKGWLNRAYA